MFKEMELHYKTMVDNTIENSFAYAIHSQDEEFYSELKEYLKNPHELNGIQLSKIKRVEADSENGQLVVYFKES